MRVLIVDDEVKVCQLIQYLIKWDDFGMDIIGMANDGYDAFEQIKKKKPDIVITDIRMPGFDGIDLVKKTQAENLDIYFVIISGYSQFEYARQAVKLGVEDYLLKPIKKKELESVLSKILAKHEKSQNVENERTQLQSQLNQTKKQMKNEFLGKLVREGGGETGAEPIEKLLDRYGVEVGGQNYYLVVAHFYENVIDGYATDERQFILEKLQAEMRERLQVYGKEVLSTIYEEEVICLLNTDHTDQEILVREMQKIISNPGAIREIFPNGMITVAVGDLMQQLNEFRNNLEQIHTIMLNHFLKEGKQIFVCTRNGVRQESNTKISDVITAAIRKRFLIGIELVDRNYVTESIANVIQRLEQYNESGSLIAECYRELIEIFLLGIKNYYEDAASFTDTDFFRGIRTFFHYEDAFEWLAKEFCSILENHKQNQKDLETRPIRMAKQFITEHYNEAVSLETVSSYIGFNPAYFSSVFKKTTGQNFMDYVTSVRIENAKAMLAQTTRDIADIANEVGYTDIKYFTKVFKKSTSLTPSDFRKLYS